jgi:hypothetical protein
MSYVDNEAQFRFPIGLQIIFAIMTFVGIWFLPESPRWLIAHKRHDEGRHILWALQPNARDIQENNPVVNIEMIEIQTVIAEEEQASSGLFKDVFKKGPQRFLRRTLLGMLGQAMQQVCP